MQIFSNADKAHVDKALRKLGLDECFDEIVCFETLNATTNEKIDECQYNTIEVSHDHHSNNNADDESELPKTPIICKPFKKAFELAFKKANINPKRTVRINQTLTLYKS